MEKEAFLAEVVQDAHPLIDSKGRKQQREA